jgi:uncharacterized protein
LLPDVPTNGNPAGTEPTGDTLRTLAAEQIQQVSDIRTAASVLLERVRFAQLHGLTFGDARDLYEVLGYDRVISNWQYYNRYARGGIAGRIVDVFPNATWRGEVTLTEDENPHDDTVFEKAWKDLDDRLQIQARLLRVDKLSQLSAYAVLLLGAPGLFDQELPRGRPDQLAYLSVFSGGGSRISDPRRSFSSSITWDADIVVDELESDPANPRFGLPKTYRLKRSDLLGDASGNATRPIHWTRVIHVADGCLYDDIYGMPALERVWNLLDDLEKVTGGGAEAFWLRANQGLHIDIDKDLNIGDADQAKKDLQEQAEAYKHQLTRWLRTRGVNVSALGSDVANFMSPADAILTQIAGAKAIPKRILTGSEMGELASSQDRDNWRDQVEGRRKQYAAPYVVRPFVGRLIKYGYLPPPKGGENAYHVRWPHTETLTETEKTSGAKSWAETKTAEGNTFSNAEIREKWYHMDPLTPEEQAKLKEQPPEPAAPPAPAGEPEPLARAAEAAAEDELSYAVQAALEGGDVGLLESIIGPLTK